MRFRIIIKKKPTFRHDNDAQRRLSIHRPKRATDFVVHVFNLRSESALLPHYLWSSDKKVAMAPLAKSFLTSPRIFSACLRLHSSLSCTFHDVTVLILFFCWGVLSFLVLSRHLVQCYISSYANSTLLTEVQHIFFYTCLAVIHIMCIKCNTWKTPRITYFLVPFPFPNSRGQL